MVLETANQLASLSKARQLPKVLSSSSEVPVLSPDASQPENKFKGLCLYHLHFLLDLHSYDSLLDVTR